jgi:hypothetical protein
MSRCRVRSPAHTTGVIEGGKPSFHAGVPRMDCESSASDTALRVGPALENCHFTAVKHNVGSMLGGGTRLPRMHLSRGGAGDALGKSARLKPTDDPPNFDGRVDGIACRTGRGEGGRGRRGQGGARLDGGMEELGQQRR